ncbi:hypothetical protein BOX15_Mlig004658g3 [Macrostomum lignano]|uniref:Innexin n=1 Tax=Macrostomum lignano TaxID=282301 RepID=A0A267FWQ9_9PLAT|nr:hypothetical protein BOX15_Mlig004658g3 [Macrostomum lignano]
MGHDSEEAGVNESVFTILNNVAGFRIGSLVAAEDFADKVNYKWSSSLLLTATFIIVMRDFAFKPIQCYTPPEWPHPWEEYAENYCWVQNNYHVSYLNTSFPTPTERSSLELNYYQWVPFVLALECLLVYIPHVIWNFLSKRSGFDPNGLVRLAKQSVDLDERRRHRLVLHLVTEIEEAMGLHEARQNWQNKSKAAKNLLECLYGMLPCFWYGRKSGFALFFLYLINKLVHLCAALGHLFMMRSFLGFEDLHFGWTCAVDLVRGREWRQTRVFPRVTFCDIPIKHLGQWNTRSIQCVLPLNILNEKLYIFLWFWTVFCISLTVISTIVWLVRVFTPKIRQQFVKKYLHKLALLVDKAKDEEEHQLRKDFVRVFLSLDGLFLLNLMEHNAGNMCVTEIIFNLYSRYKEQRREDRRGERHDLNDGSDGPSAVDRHDGLTQRRAKHDY